MFHMDIMKSKGKPLTIVTSSDTKHESNGSLESAGRTDSVDQSQSDSGDVFMPDFMRISYEDILRDLPMFPGQ